MVAVLYVMIAADIDIFIEKHGGKMTPEEIEASQGHAVVYV